MRSARRVNIESRPPIRIVTLPSQLAGLVTYKPVIRFQLQSKDCVSGGDWILINGVYVKSLGRFGKAVFAGIGFYASGLILGAPAGAVPVANLPLGGPVCAGGVVTQTAGDGPAAAAPIGAAGAVPCGPAAADLTTLAGPVPMGLPGPVPPVPIAPIPVVPGMPPPVPMVAPGPAGAAAASPIAGLMTDAISAPIGLAGGTK